MRTTRPVVIVDYDPQWPVWFERMRKVWAEAMGPLAVAIEHVGSTAVPGLASKPIIDSIIVIASRDDLPAAVEALGRLGYEHRGDQGVAGREALRGGGKPDWPYHPLRPRLRGTASPDHVPRRPAGSPRSGATVRSAQA
jgi:GrpB-like predicted nucleotidyltransferase (UPF0157 family)